MAASNWTSPSFASIFTGLVPSRHQVVHRARLIPDSLQTLTEYFRGMGYATEAIMYKAYLYNMGFEQGFDRWFNVPRHDVHAALNLDKAMKWLQRNKDRQFFLFLHFNDPHQPFNQPDPWPTHFSTAADLRRYGVKLPITITGSNDVLGCPKCAPNQQPSAGFKNLARQLYDSEIAYVDNRLAVFLDALRAQHLYDNTLIAFVADHGEMMWEHANTFGHGGPYLYDTLVRVPLIIKPPKGVLGHPGKRVGSTVQAFDVMPTLIDLAGGAVPAELNARSLWPLMRDDVPQDVDGPPTFSENVKQQVTAVRHDGFKLVLSHPPGQIGRERLFDLKTDPLEQRDVSALRLDVLTTHRSYLADFIAANRRGLFLAVVAAAETQPQDVQIELQHAARTMRSFFALKGIERGKRALRLRGVTAGPLIAFVKLETRDDAVVTVRVKNRGNDGASAGDGQPAVVETTLRAADAPRYASGDLQRAIAGGKAGVYLWHGPPPAEQRISTKTNAQRLETLRALGYVQ